MIELHLHELFSAYNSVESNPISFLIEGTQKLNKLDKCDIIPPSYEFNVTGPDHRK